jgi:succinyl-diaminopimelate desuccinylase
LLDWRLCLNQLNKTINLAAELIRCRSVAPEDDGAQSLLQEKLHAIGFQIFEVPCQGRKNFWAEAGRDGPLLAFAVHTDVVPEGDLSGWTVDPFAGTVRDGRLIGRGAVDMKSQIACVVSAIEWYVSEIGGTGHLPFRLGMFVTGDEEPEGNFGANAILDFLAGRETRIDYCVVTEPTSQEEFGDTVKIGRRGSIHGEIRLLGQQMHSSHADQLINPIFRSLPVLKDISDFNWCPGNAYFPKTTFQFTRIQASGGASNTTPAELSCEFNLRFSSETSAQTIQNQVEKILSDSGVNYRTRWSCNAHPFLTEPGPFTELVRDAVQKVSGIHPQYSTSGGTSDGRFIAARGTALIEFGFVGNMCHMVDESAPLEEIDKLQQVYQQILIHFANHPTFGHRKPDA